MKKKQKVELFLDSGAYSALTQKIEIDIHEYIKFIKKHERYLQVYANLDAIGDPVQTLENQNIMEKEGLNPLPCFHMNEPIEYLKHYLDHYDYIALGGMVGDKLSSINRVFWLDEMFTKYLCESDGMPKVKVHGFGLTSLKLMMRYPWYSVDSTSWVMTGRLGSVYVPRYEGGEFLYNKQSWKVCVSSLSPDKKEAGKHINSFPPKHKQIIFNYFESKGYRLGLSKMIMGSADHKLRKNEKWVGKAVNGKRQVEVIKEDGLSNNYRLRDELNVIYFLDLEKSMRKWPWSFKIKATQGFGL